MANALYGKGRQAFGNAEIDWGGTGNIKVALVDSTNYVIGANIDVHEYMNTDTVPANSRPTNGVSGNLASKDNTLGTMDADNIVLGSVSGPPTDCEYVIVFLDGGGGGVSASGTTDFLIALYDTFDSGMPVTPNGGDITVAWHASGLFKL